MLFFWCIELLCCLCIISLSCRLATKHEFDLWILFRPSFHFLNSYFYFYFAFLFSVSFVAVASLHCLTQVCISILTVASCYSVGAVLIFLSDLLSLFLSWHFALVLLFCLETYVIGYLYKSVVLSVMFIACGAFYLFFSLPFICATFFNLLNLLLWYCSSLSISCAWSF